MNLGTGDAGLAATRSTKRSRVLRRDWLDLPGGTEDEVDQADQADQADREAKDGAREGQRLGVAVLERDEARMDKRLQISDILVRYVRNGARTLSDVQQAISAQDLKEVTAICDGAPLRDVLLDG